MHSLEGARSKGSRVNGFTGWDVGCLTTHCNIGFAVGSTEGSMRKVGVMLFVLLVFTRFLCSIKESL